MTACVNRKHTKKVAAVVTASLVGALSLGAAPVAAMAATDTGVDLLVADWSTDVTVTRATDGKGGVVSNPSQATFTKGSGKYLVPVTIENDFQTTQVNTNDYVFEYYSDSSCTSLVATTLANAGYPADPAVAFANPAAGTYYLKIAKKTSAGTASATDATDPIAFKIVEDSFEGAYVYEYDTDGTTDDTTFVYNGDNYYSDIKVAKADGTPIALGSGDTMVVRDSSGVVTTNVTNAGSYNVVLTIDGKEYNIPFTVEKLNLSEAALTVSDMTATSFPQSGNVATRNDAILALTKLNGTTIGTGTTMAGLLTIGTVSGPDGTNYFNESAKGEYTFTVKEKGNNSNIDGTATVKFTYLDSDVVNGNAKYGSQTISGGSTLSFSVADGEAFDASRLKVVDGNTTYSGDQLEVTYIDQATGKAVDAAALANPGKYDVHMRLKPFQTFAEDKWIGGSVDFVIEVKGVSVSTDKVAFYFDGELAGASESVSYDGTNQLEKISAVVKGAEGEDLVEGTDYTIEVTKGSKTVDEAIDEGTYTVTIKPITFDFGGAPATDYQMQLVIDPVDLSVLVADTDDMAVSAADNGQISISGNSFYVPFTGSAVEVPGVKYQVVNGSKYTYPVLSADLYNIVSITSDDTGKVVTEPTDEGTYTVKIALSDAAGSNYSFGATGTQEYKFTIKEYGHFADVDSSKWYSVPVEKAYDLHYVYGISGTNLFAPEADITRADAVCILFNMAGGNSAYGDDEFSYSEDKGYDTGFNDVDGHAYFAKALAWAHASEVANGSNGDFRPYDKITREEFASLLANFAKNKGDFTAADEGALDGVSDANTVSDWAEDNVAWAVENGVMGNGGFVAGQSNITRAEVAAMAVNYQPEAL